MVRIEISYGGIWSLYGDNEIYCGGYSWRRGVLEKV
jgi:hypothetical protein